MISTTEYKSISDDLGEAHTQGFFMSDNMFDMSNSLSAAQVETGFNRTQLSAFIEETYYLTTDNHRTARKEILDVVRLLQGLIIDENGDVNQYLVDNNLKVRQDFADLSEIVGFSINSENIE